MSYILQIGTINAGSISLTTKFFEMKMEKPEPILTVKITKWRKLVDYFGLSIEGDPSRLGKKNVHFSILGI